MKSDTAIRSHIMKRVYAVYALRQLSRPGVKLGALLILLISLRELVFVTRVIENASLKQNVFESAGYLLGALAGTEFIVQVVVVLAAVVTLYMMKDMASLFRPQYTSA